MHRWLNATRLPLGLAAANYVLCPLCPLSFFFAHEVFYAGH
jgi:hypothetical protein